MNIQANPKLSMIFTSRLISTMADQILLFLIPLVIYKITSSAAMSGLSFAIEWLPRIMAFLLSGLWGDRIGGGKLFVRTDFYRGTIIFIFLAVLLSGYGNIFWLLTIMGGCIGFLSSQAQLSLELTIKNNFIETDIPKVQAKAQISEQLSLILGPFCAGLMLECVHYLWPIAISGALFFISWFINKIIYPNSHLKNSDNNSRNTSALTSFKRACAVIYNSKQLSLVIVFSLLANFFFGVILTLNPAIVKSVFQESDQQLSFLYSVAGIVTIGSLSFIPFLSRYLSVKKIGIIGILIFCGSALALSKVAHFKLYICCYAFLVAGVMLTNIMTRTYRVQLIPSADFAITVGLILFIIKAAMPVSGLFVSVFSERMDLQEIILWAVMGSIFIFSVVWALFFLRLPLFKKDRLENA